MKNPLYYLLISRDPPVLGGPFEGIEPCDAERQRVAPKEPHVYLNAKALGNLRSQIDEKYVAPQP